MPNFLEFMFDKLTSPFAILQYIFCVVYILAKYVTFSATLLSFVFFTTLINYVLLYFSYRKIRDMAERKMNVEVIRNGKK